MEQDFLFGALIPLFMMLLGEKFGPQVLGRAMALANLMMLPVMAASLLFSAAVYEERGSYASAFAVLTLGMLASIGCVFGASRVPGIAGASASATASDAGDREGSSFEVE